MQTASVSQVLLWELGLYSQGCRHNHNGPHTTSVQFYFSTWDKLRHRRLSIQHVCSYLTHSGHVGLKIFLITAVNGFTKNSKEAPKSSRVFSFVPPSVKELCWSVEIVWAFASQLVFLSFQRCWLFLWVLPGIWLRYPSVIRASEEEGCLLPRQQGKYWVCVGSSKVQTGEANAFNSEGIDVKTHSLQTETQISDLALVWRCSSLRFSCLYVCAPHRRVSTTETVLEK